jgi:hypothetical protein
MLSDFLFAKDDLTFFSLIEEEWTKAIADHHDLMKPTDVDYEPRSASASIDLSNNTDTDLNQMERLFILLQYSQKINFPIKHNVESIVDNIRTLSALAVNIYDFRLRPGGNCPVET